MKGRNHPKSEKWLLGALLVVVGLWGHSCAVRSDIRTTLRHEFRRSMVPVTAEMVESQEHLTRAFGRWAAQYRCYPTMDAVREAYPGQEVAP